MCLAIPGKVLSSEDVNGSRVARVEFGGSSRMVCLDLVPEAAVGDFVLVHVGYAISRVDQEEAERTYEALQAMGKLAEEGLVEAEADEVRR
jgi:hydrogenase expression/formation protein HypC